MSQTWVIKDTAPVDAASRELSAQQCSFTSNEQEFSSISIVESEAAAVYVLTYDNFEVAGAEVGLGSYEFNWSGNEAYKTLIFDTAPTGELLAWLQKNADKQVDTEYLTNTADLKAVADAIRAKGGTSAQLAFPDGFVSAVQAIEGAPDLQIVVTTSAGATVTATKGSKTVSGTADASGHCTLTVDEVGTWTVTALSGSMSKSIDVVVGSVEAMLNLIDPVFANNDWSAIIAACQSGSVPDGWAVGDSKEMTINTKAYQIDIIGKNHDDYADGSGKAPLTFQIHACYSKAKMLNSNVTYTWQKSTMRTSTLPAILKKMPAEVQAAIREVTKLSGESAYGSSLESTADKLFILSDDEVGKGYNSVVGEGTKYEYYTSTDRCKKTYNNAASYWWLRSICTDNNNKGSVKCINSDGSLYQFVGSATTYGVSFGFCF